MFNRAHYHRDKTRERYILYIIEHIYHHMRPLKVIYGN